MTLPQKCHSLLIELCYPKFTFFVEFVIFSVEYKKIRVFFYV